MSTKESPTCYHRALDHLSSITGQSKYKTLVIAKAEYLRTKPHPNRHDKSKFKTKLLYKADSIKIETECGKTVSYFPQPNMRFDQCGYVFKRALVEVSKSVNEFGVDIESCGNYTDCLGGGWTQKVGLFRIGNFYFASMDCSCR